MFSTSNELPADSRHLGLDIRRTPPTGAIHGIVTSTDLLVVKTHHYRGRTTPCLDADCPACGEAIPYRVHVYLTIFDAKLREHFLFECTAKAAEPLAAYRQANGKLRGCILHASRPKGTRNGKVWIQTNTTDLSKAYLPPPPDIIALLCTLWRIPRGAASQAEHHRQNADLAVPETTIEHHLAVDHRPINRMNTQPDNAGGAFTIREILDGNGRTR